MAKQKLNKYKLIEKNIETTCTSSLCIFFYNFAKKLFVYMHYEYPEKSMIVDFYLQIFYGDFCINDYVPSLKKLNSIPWNGCIKANYPFQISNIYIF